ncbi:MAG: ABC transporter substrate-binding protein [Eubacteriales bacterium]|nr:ABC transporter substrate-binding protein [Lachnospiraceae bacterium]MDD5858984.1 ABC transporter substrate-binding protein [Eubacteriales bacterium]MCH4063062.1 ABC transporter substrate-binding protein [Lachnospiraceae bacterium]MCH4104370.1 ABC transporter substrate-binding protein [Lachnospiraceae bacterium]MCI1310215.1 ABC transporter substrate-binding protein [Lachnospiraceae bacterium]
MMKRKMFTTALAAVCALSLCACGSSSKTASSSAAAASSAETAGSVVTGTDSTESTLIEATGNTFSTTADVSGKTYKVGIIQYVDDASLNQIEANIESELDAIGSKLGCTFDYKDYVKNGQADGTVLNQIASELISDKVDLIIPIATPTAQIVQTATEDNQIPVVFAASSDPVGAGLVSSMDKPGANITGTSDALNTEAIMNLITAVNPDVKKVGILYSKSEDSSTQPVKDAEKYLDSKGISYVEKTGTTNDEVSSAADALVAEGVDAVFTPTDNTIMKAELAIYEKFQDAGIPQYCGADSFALNGAFCGYGVDYANLGVATADMAADILVNGKNPADVPVETFDNGIATVNTDTCEAIGLNFDDVKNAMQPYCTLVQKITTAQEFSTES